jgi:hypothetical protein
VKAREVTNAVRACLVQKRRGPKRPSEPRAGGVYPSRAEVGKKDGQLPCGLSRDGSMTWQLARRSDPKITILHINVQYV